MIIVTSLDDNSSEDNIVDEQTKLKYRSFNEILRSLYNSINDFITIVDTNKIGLTLDYKKRISNNIEEFIDLENISESNSIQDVQLLDKEIVNNHYSKLNHKIISLEEKKNMDFGTRIHTVLEYIDFKNPELDKLELDSYIKSKILKFLNSDLLKNINDASIYKEFQFIDQFGTIGIIDCMLVYSDHIDIIDYKLKNVVDDAYVKQLNGYKKYIEERTNKKTNIYLYSILDEKFVSL